MSVIKKIIKTVPYLLFVPLVLIFYFPAIAGIAADIAPLKEITVVSDDNYPPFIFRDAKGHLQGILVDEWHLWEEKTGIKVALRGMDWDKAQKTMAEGNAQVIDTIFFTEERAKTLAFSTPLYTGQFRRAVHKERKDLLTAVEEGFAKISPKEHEEIENRWRGSPIARPYLTYLLYLMGGSRFWALS